MHLLMSTEFTQQDTNYSVLSRYSWVFTGSCNFKYFCLEEVCSALLIV